MDQTFGTQKELETFVRKSIENPGLLERVRKLLGGESITDARIRNWLQRGNIPDQIVLGAAMLMLAEEKDLPGTNRNEAIPQPLLHLQRSALDRTMVWAKSAWHIFWVDDKPGALEQDVTVWRVWKDLQTTGIDSRWFTHASLVEHEVDHSGLICGADSKSDSHVDTKQLGVVSFQTRITDTPRTVGYHFIAKRGVHSFAKGEQTHEFLGGVNVVPVVRAYYILNIPVKRIKEVSPALLRFASFISPMKLIANLVTYDKVAGLLETTSPEHRFVQPWGEVQGTELTFEKVQAPGDEKEVPPELVEVLKTKWASFPVIGNDHSRRLAVARVDLPEPLLFQSIVYALPQKRSDSVK